MALIDKELKQDEIVEKSEINESSTLDENVASIDLSVTRKKRFNIDGDPNRVLELNTSDMNVIGRLEAAYPKLEKLSGKAAREMQISEDEDDMVAMTKMSSTLKEIDGEMRALMDELFDANVSEVCAPSGTMYDPFYGKFRYEYIIEALMGLYDTNFTSEYNSMKARMAKHTDKYTKKKF